jgi:glycine oxidase
MSTHSDILIIGGGVIGLTTAYYLARAGARVSVVDQGDLGRQASWAGAGIIPPGNPHQARCPFDRLRAHSCTLYPILSQELREQTGIDNGYVVCGGLELAAPGEEAPDEEWRSEGLAFRTVEGIELRRLAPGLAASVTQAFYLPDMAQVRNPRHLQALMAACKLLGAELRPGWQVRTLNTRACHVQGADTPQGMLVADRFLVAAGAWSDQLLQDVGWRPGIRPVRGQIALLDTKEPGIRPILLAGKRYLVPRTDGRVLVGSTEEDAGFDACPTVGGVAGLLEFAVSLVPALANAPLERCWAGLRPGSPDGMPFLGKVPGYDNLYVAAGHFRAGLQLSPATGKALSDLLLDHQPFMPLEPFRLDRAAGLPAQTAFLS